MKANACGALSLRQALGTGLCVHYLISSFRSSVLSKSSYEPHQKVFSKAFQLCGTLKDVQMFPLLGIKLLWGINISA